MGTKISKAKTSTEASSAPDELFKKPVPVMQSRHGALRVNRESYAYAKNLSMVRLSGAEFAAAGHDFPIVFMMIEDQPVPMALMGLRKSENLFVDRRGQWAPGTYLPAYLRLYPFLLAEVQDTRSLAVFVDQASPLLSKNTGLKIYDRGQYGPALSSAVELGREYHFDQIKTRFAMNALKAQDVFVRQDLSVETTGPKPIKISGLWVVDRKKFSTLSDAAFLELRAKGALELVHLHFASLNRLDALGRRRAA